MDTKHDFINRWLTPQPGYMPSVINQLSASIFYIEKVQNVECTETWQAKL